MFFCPTCNNIIDIVSNNAPAKPDNINNIDNLNNLNNIDNISQIIYKCSNCGFSDLVKPGTKILSISTVLPKVNKPLLHSVSNLSPHLAIKYKNMIHDPTLPRTNNYVCPNKQCNTHENESLKEAAWFKPYMNSHYIITICKSCETLW
jgi:hypothetical protein